MEVIFEDEEIIATRFQCACTNPACAIDITRMKKSQWLGISFWSTPISIWKRICWCYSMLIKGVGFEHEYIVRKEDVEDLIGVMKGGE